jgi:hypothetical protein
MLGVKVRQYEDILKMDCEDRRELDKILSGIKRAMQQPTELNLSLTKSALPP